ncbi:MAG: polymorphic toxin-type HINT domain-containing protein [Phycisphaerae bacterium]
MLPNPHIDGGVLPYHPIDSPSSSDVIFSYDANLVNVGTTVAALSGLPTLGGSNLPHVEAGQQFDALYRLLSHAKTSDDNQFLGSSPVDVTRTYSYTPDADGRPLVRVGPDGVQAEYSYDDAGRLATATQGDFSAAYERDAAGQVTSVTLGNGTRTRYEYDAAERLSAIVHERLVGAAWLTMKQLVYGLDAAGRITTIDETDCAAASPLEGCQPTYRFYAYDARNRLTLEGATAHDYGSLGPSHADYAFEYEYDLGGNRTLKRRLDPQTGQPIETTEYHYDYDYAHGQPAEHDYGTRANRLMYFAVKDAAGVETRRVSFAYERTGNPRYVVTSRPSDPVRRAYSLHYTKQNALWLVVKSEWEVQGGAVVNERRSAAEEILTEGVGIARTLTRRLSPPESDPDGQTSPLAWEFVSEVLVSTSADFVEVDFADETIRCTRRHPFYCVSSGWTAAGELRAGDCLISLSREERRIHSVRHVGKSAPVQVYNLRVGAPHDFFVGNTPVLVHNKPP